MFVMEYLLYLRILSGQIIKLFSTLKVGGSEVILWSETYDIYLKIYCVCSIFRCAYVCYVGRMGKISSLCRIVFS
jgi:hypothetical protein